MRIVTALLNFALPATTIRSRAQISIKSGQYRVALHLDGDNFTYIAPAASVLEKCSSTPAARFFHDHIACSAVGAQSRMLPRSELAFQQRRS